MIPGHLSDVWTALAPALGDHLWQSTLFAAVAGIFTLGLRKNHARVRYGLWLVASLKFLVPFTVLVALGRQLAWKPGGMKARLYVAIDEVSQPFTQPALRASSGVYASSAAPSHMHWLPEALIALWVCGFAAVVAAWWIRWRKVDRAIRESRLLHEGREIEALRRMEHRAGVRHSISVVLSRKSLEPGIFGIIRPILIWPIGISEHLDDAHLDAIMAHEVCHARRRDNLAAALHMLVEAAFWFHPLVWWLGARLMDERERACDESVLEFGSERHVYAESILKTCEFCAGLSLACVSGVTGADLKKRIVDIMTQPVFRKLDFSRKLLLGAAGLLVIAVPVLFGLQATTPSQTESQPQKPASTATGQAPEASPAKPAAASVSASSKAAPPKKKACSKSARARKDATPPAKPPDSGNELPESER